jgi:N-acetyl-alpha-D-glucosaminyl L-malate synthase BshA
LVTLHGSDVDPLGRDPAYAPIIRHALSRAARVTAPSRHLRALAMRTLDVDVSIDVVANFVDGERFRPLPDRPPPSRDGAMFIHASNFREVKRVADVVAIFARVAARTPARLLLVGDGPERGAALTALERLGLSDRVEAPGARRDIERFLGRAHVALLPSERESFGLAALEALACAVPVVATAVGGLPEVVQHGHTGSLAAVGDVDAMAEAACTLVADDAEWHRMACAARAHALLHFAPDGALDAYVAFYRSAMLEPPAHARGTSRPRPAHDA